MARRRRQVANIGLYGKSWSVRVAPYIRGKWGYCDYDKREVVLCRTTQREGIDREILIHELLHKIMPFLDEDCVAAAAVELEQLSFLRSGVSAV